MPVVPREDVIVVWSDSATVAVVREVGCGRDRLKYREPVADRVAWGLVNDSNRFCKLFPVDIHNPTSSKENLPSRHH